MSGFLSIANALSGGYMDGNAQWKAAQAANAEQPKVISFAEAQAEQQRFLTDVISAMPFLNEELRAKAQEYAELLYPLSGILPATVPVEAIPGNPNSAVDLPHAKAREILTSPAYWQQYA